MRVAVAVIVPAAIVGVFGVLVVFVGMTVLIMLVSLVMSVFMSIVVSVVVPAAIVRMFMLFVRMTVLVFLMSVPTVFMMLVTALVAMPIVSVFVLVIAVMRVCCSRVNAEFYAFNFAAFLAVKVHVEISEIELGELPFQGGGFDSKVAERADCHVAADARKTVEIKYIHGDGD